MKGLVFDIKRYSVNDGPGIRTSVFFKGCPLQCIWCHNPESQSSEPVSMKRIRKLEDKTFREIETVGCYMDSNDVFRELIKDRIFFEESGGGVTFSGGEPTRQIDFLIELARMLHVNAVHTALDTCGYAALDTFIKLDGLIDLYLFDLKLIDTKLHKFYTGQENKVILQNLKFLSESHRDIIIRIPCIESITLTRENMEGIIQFLTRLPNPPLEIHLLPFHAIAAGKYERLKMENPMKDIENLYPELLIPYMEMFKNEGFRVKIHGSNNQSI